MPIMNTVIKGSGGSAPAHYIEKTVDANGVLQNGSTNIIDLTGVKNIGQYVLYYAYYENLNITGVVNMGDVETLTNSSSCNNAFKGCRNITGINVDSLKTITGASCFDYSFSGCIGITGVSFPSLIYIGNGFSNAFNGCTGITSVDMNCLTTIVQGMFQSFNGCTGITSFKMDSIKKITGNTCCASMLKGCTNLTSLSLPSITTTTFGTTYTNQFNNMLQNIPSITIHFPSNVQSVIEGLQGYSTTAPFGAISGTVLFDLPATVILNGANSQAYERSPKDDTVTALAWRVQDTGTAPNLVIDWTPFYTSGTTDPAVSDTIYSDSACTTAVTTISSIA